MENEKYLAKIAIFIKIGARFNLHPNFLTLILIIVPIVIIIDFIIFGLFVFKAIE